MNASVNLKLLARHTILLNENINTNSIIGLDPKIMNVSFFIKSYTCPRNQSPLRKDANPAHDIKKKKPRISYVVYVVKIEKS